MEPGAFPVRLSRMTYRRYFAAAFAASFIALLPAVAASATELPCLPAAAIPAVEEVSHIEAAIWANFSPNKDQGPLEGAPVWPLDPRGTWQLHDQLPGGHADEPDGVYQKGNGHGSWFYKQAARVVIDVEAVPGVDAVVCPPPVVEEEPPAEEPPAPPADKPVTTEVEKDIKVTSGVSKPPALPHTGLSDEQVLWGAVGIALIVAGGVAVYTARKP